MNCISTFSPHNQQGESLDLKHEETEKNSINSTGEESQVKSFTILAAEFKRQALS